MNSQGMSARRRVAVSVVPGLLVAVGAAVGARAWDVAAVAGWDAAGFTFLVLTWRAVWRLEHVDSRRHAEREDPTTGVADLILLSAALASLGAIGVVLATGKTPSGTGVADLILAVASVAVSWAVVHTAFALKYARLYYAGQDGGLDFHDPVPPAYKDFAYLAFTIGMTFQVSDTEITSHAIRVTVLRHALISYVFGAVILGVIINLLGSLSG